MGVIIALLGLLVFLNRKGGVNPISILTIAVSFIVIFLGLWVPALHWLYDASIIVGTLVAMLVYYLMMKAGDSSYMAVSYTHLGQGPARQSRACLLAGGRRQKGKRQRLCKRLLLN